MKKLKIISLFFLISLFFITNVKASGTYNFIPMNSTIINNYLSNHSGSTSQDFYDMLVDNLNYTSEYDNYVCLLYLDNGGVDCYSTDGEFKLFAGITGYGGRPSLQLLLPQGDRVETSYSITFNNIGEYVSHTSYTSIPSYFSSLSLTNNSSTLIYIPIISNNSTILYDNSYPSANTYYDSFSFNSLVTYSVNNEVNLSDFGIGTNYIASVYDPLSNPYKCNIDFNGFRTGVLQNVSDVSFRVRGSNVVSEYPLEGSFALQNTSFTATDSFDFVTYIDLDIIKGDESDNTYNVSGTKRWDNSTKTFTIDYKITPLTDNATIFDVIFKISPNSNVVDDFFQKGSINVFDCQPLNVYVDNTYGYTDNNTGATVSTDTGLMNILNNANSPDLGFFNNLNTLLPPGPIDSILNIPAVMYSAINSFLGGDCEPLNFTLPWVNQQVQLKCIRSFYSDINATLFVEGVGSIASIVILISYFVNLYNWFDDHLQITHKKVKVWGGE